ncbi:MAG: hypothetical protein EXR79_01635 [Myxococcales bacterium]|nr:hypothetical protein [Myxococcales bacterium]
MFDGNLCSGQWKCDRSVAAKGTCGLDKALAVQCSPPPNVAVGDKECTVAACNPKTGLCEVQVKPDAMPCKDALECTLVTHCQQGKCVPTANGNGCDCIGGTDAECAAWKQKTIDFGVASACTGLAFCIAATRMCALDEASVVKCSTANDGPCAATSCAPATGTCVKAATNEGKVCNDGNPCTANDLCAKGKCQVGKVNLCPCGVDTDCAKHEDGDLCNGTLICDTAGKVCNLKPGTVVACTGGLDSVCAVTACVPTTGQCAVLPIEAVQPKDPKCNPKVKQCAWLAKPAGSAAADPVLCGGSDPCSGGFVCQGGQCKPGDAVVVCKCKSDAECQDDGNLCNGKPTCNLDSGQCEVQPKSVVKCASSAECFKLACQPSTGKCVAKPEPDGQACSDNNSCTGDDSCAQGKCVGGTLLCLCDTDADCKKLDDGNPCNGTLFCDLAKAKPDCQIDKATVVLCPVSPHETTCLKNQCHPPTGTCTLKPTHNYQYCDDDNACTKWEVCVAGQCYSPDNDCPCQADADCATKDDKNACNGTLFCAGAGGKGVCATKAKSAVNCLAGAGTCAVSACNPATGSCAPAAAPNGASCDDGDPCTKYDECMDGKCSPGPAQCKCKSTPDCAEYEDESKCTAPLVCGANQSCTPDLQWLAPKCAIGDACLSQACSPKTGACVTSANDTACEDGNPCTLDLCAPDGACKHSALDGDACGPKLVCKAGTCAAP